VIERTADPAFVNKLAGCDLSEALAEPLHVCLIEDESGAFFAWRGPGVYELHLFFAVKGKAAVALLMRMIEMMRAKHGARWFWALIPVERRNVRLFARWMGWLPQGVLTTRYGPNELFVSENI
jgi:hypothetical protein